MNEQFFTLSVKHLKNYHSVLLKTPRAKAPKELKAEIAQILDFLRFSLKNGDITKGFYKQIALEISQIDFENLGQQRQKIKEAI